METTLMRTTTVVASLALLATLALGPISTVSAGTGAKVTGGGSFLFGGSIPMQFGVSAITLPDGSTTGAFHHSYSDDVASYQFFGTVTCLAVDEATGRAWIGGVLSKVITDDPDVGLAPGDDAWFRVLDRPDGDRSTAMGFVGAIPSSEAYCSEMPWPDDNARTHPVTSGQVTVIGG
jgi:hypothetical protein